MSDPTPDELKAVAAKMDQEAVDKALEGMRLARWRVLLNHPSLRLWWTFDLRTDYPKKLGLPILDLIADPEARSLLIYRTMQPAWRKKLLTWIQSLPVMPLGYFLDPVTGESVPDKKEAANG